MWGVRVSETTIQRIDRVTGLATRHRPIREISFRGHDDLSSPVSLTPQPLFQWHVVVFVVYGHRLWWWSGCGRVGNRSGDEVGQVVWVETVSSQLANHGTEESCGIA